MTTAAIHHIGTSEHGYRLAARLSDDAPGPQWVSTVDGDWIEVPLDYVRAVETVARKDARAALADGCAHDVDADSAAWADVTLRDLGLDMDADAIEGLNEDAGHSTLWQIYARAWGETVDAD